MDDTADDTQPRPVGERSTGDLVKLLSEQVSALVRDELRLVQLEMTRKGKQAGAGIGMLSSGGLVALYGAGLPARGRDHRDRRGSGGMAGSPDGRGRVAGSGRCSGAAGQEPTAERHPAGPAGGRRQH